MSDKPTCGAKTRGDGRCKRPAGWGTDHVGVGRCKLHGGSTPTHQKGAQVELARLELERMGIAVEIDPRDALMAMVWEAHGNVAFLRAKVQELGEWELYGPVKHDEPKAEPHVLVSMYDAERERLAKFSAAAIKAGIEQRRLEIAEADARFIFGAVIEALRATGLDAQAQEAFRREFASRIAAGPRPLGAAG